MLVHRGVGTGAVRFRTTKVSTGLNCVHMLHKRRNKWV